MRALALEHLHSNPVGVYGDVLLDRGIEVHRVRLDLEAARGEPTTRSARSRSSSRSPARRNGLRRSRPWHAAADCLRVRSWSTSSFATRWPTEATWSAPSSTPERFLPTAVGSGKSAEPLRPWNTSKGAFTGFAQLGAEPWLAQARSELEACGAPPPDLPADPLSGLG
jgi:hypothetical protein